MRGISPVVATVLMVAIAIAAAVVAYSWLMSVQSQAQAAAGETASKVGTETLRIVSVTCDGNKYSLIVQNMGDTDVTFTNAIVKEGSGAPQTIASTDITGTATAGQVSTIVVGNDTQTDCDGAKANNTTVEITLYTEAGTPVTWKGVPS